MKLSVIICTHNPRATYLDRVLKALERQTFPNANWELLLIDNASASLVEGRFDLGWHPNARHIREDELGLTPARLRGISESRGELLVFVDDDNVLTPNYLDEAVRIGREWPSLGAWGGSIKGEFELEPQPWLQPLLGFLAIREFSKPIWSNNPEDWRAQPCGAGLVVRMAVAKCYAHHIATDPRGLQLDRRGTDLASCGDSHLVQKSCDVGMGFGNFPELRLTHLIPESRVRPEYLIRLMQNITASGIVLQYLRSGALPPRPNTLKTWTRYLLTCLREGRPQARIYKAQQDAVHAGIDATLGLMAGECVRQQNS